MYSVWNIDKKSAYNQEIIKIIYMKCARPYEQPLDRFVNYHLLENHFMF